MEPDKLIADLAITSEVCGHLMSEAACQIIVKELSTYPYIWVSGALARCRRELSTRLTLAAIFERLDDGRPGPQEAWAMLPKNEYDSAVLTTEMGEAMGPAINLINSGDLVGGRMVFLEVYRKAVERSRSIGEPVNWFPSLGWDPTGREAALADAVKTGKIEGSACPIKISALDLHESIDSK